MSCKRAERAILRVTPPNKNGNNHNNKFKFQRRNNEGNTRNPSSSRNSPSKRFRKQGTCYVCKRNGHYKAHCYKRPRWTVKIRGRDISSFCIFWILFSWCSAKLMVNWYWGILTCYNLLQGFEREKEAKPGQGWFDLWEWKESRM